jgi:hypothetical protein
MIPQVLSLIQRTFDGPARGRPMRLYAAVLARGDRFIVSPRSHPPAALPWRI